MSTLFDYPNIFGNMDHTYLFQQLHRECRCGSIPYKAHYGLSFVFDPIDANVPL